MSEIAVLRRVDQLTSRLSLYTRPSECSLKNAAFTAAVSWSSIVNAWRDQSGDAPTRRNCSQIFPPYVFTHACTSPTNASRPRSCRDTPRSRARVFSTTVCVAIPAWSVPGTQSVGRPRMRCHRTTASSMAAMSAWPRCREPVTFGGGMTMTKGFRVAVELPASSTRGPAPGPKKPAASHHAYVAASTSLGSYTLGRGPP